MKHTLYLLSILLIFSSCGRDVSKAFDKLKAECASSPDPKKQIVPSEKCRQWYPVAEKEKEVITKYLPGKPVIDTEYVPALIDCDELIKQNSKGPQIVKVKVPVYSRVDTNLIVTNIKVKDMQEIEYWQKKYEIASGDKQKLSENLNAQIASNNTLTKSLYNSRVKLYVSNGLWAILLVLYLLKNRIFKV